MTAGTKIAFRSVVRNRRRSFMTIGSIAAGTTAILLIGALLSYLLLSIETSAVRRSGHLSIFAKDYYDFGASDPQHYAIADYDVVIRALREDKELRRYTRVVTPYQNIFGLISNVDSGTAKTFFGRGIIWSDRQRMNEWDPYRLSFGRSSSVTLRDNDAGAAVVGEGLGQLLGLCGALRINNCRTPPAATAATDPTVAALPHEDFSGLKESDRSAGNAGKSDTRPPLDLLTSTSHGAPNVMRVYAERAERQPTRELDDSTVLVQLKLSQSLVYGRDRPQISGLILQLNDTAAIASATARVRALIAARNFGLEVYDYVTLTPFYVQTRTFFKVLFGFIAIIVGMIVVFTISNTMMMSVLERTSEIGTMRALGTYQAGVRNQFLLEGTMLGAAGTLTGVVAAIVVAAVLNEAGLTWQPPTAAAPMPFRLHLIGENLLLFGVPVFLVLVACLASWLPAKRAGRMTVVEALRHV